MSNIVYFSYDADSAGSKIGRAILKDDLKAVKEISEKIHAGNQLVYRWAKDREGIQYSSGGDQGAYAIPSKYATELDSLRKDYEYLTGLTISVGTGKHLSESGQALLMAKLKGKNQIVEYNDETKKEIDVIRKRAKNKRYKSMEEFKIAEAYLEKSEDPHQDECPYCQQSDGTDPDHCKYCHDQEQEEGCKYCNQNSQAAEMPELGEQDCQFCKEMDQQGKDDCKYCNEEKTAEQEPNVLGQQLGTSPDSKNESAPAGSPEEKELYERMDMHPPEIGKPEPGDHFPPGQNSPMDSNPYGLEVADDSEQPSGDPGKLDPRLNTPDAMSGIDPEDNHSDEALRGIAEQITQEGQPDTQEVNAIDDTDLAAGNEMEGNISRPDDYAQNTPQDMGAEGPNPPAEPGDEEPDYYEVLESGLNENAESIKKEKAVQVVSQALMQFKASKNTLENIKMQAPDLYAASLSMLKAMIEMAGLLVLNPSAQAPQQAQQPGQPTGLGMQQKQLMPPPAEEKPQEEQNDEWHDPFPTHPDSGGEAKPQHAPSKNNSKPPDKKEGLNSPQP